MARQTGLIVKVALAMFIFLSMYSIVYALILPYFGESIVESPYSVTSGGQNGLSEMRHLLENSGFETKIIITDPEAAINIRRRMIYTIIAPSMDYDAQSVLTILSLLYNGSSILIVDDYGRANSLLEWMFKLMDPEMLFMGFFGGIPENMKILEFKIYFNTSVAVLDASSYWNNPANLIIRNFVDVYGIFSRPLNGILAKFASTLFVYVKYKLVGPGYNDTEYNVSFPLPYVPYYSFMASTRYSWLETNFQSIINGEAKPDNEWGGVPFVLGMALDFGEMGRLMIITDPDIFTNGVLDNADELGLDNRQFIIDIFSWLGGDRTRLVVFDESRKGLTILNPFFGLAISMKVITAFTRYWVVAPLIPIVFVMFFIVYLPHQIKKEVKLFKITGKKLGISPYYSRYLWYMYRGGYTEAFKILVDNLRRSIKLKLGIPSDKWEEILEALERRRPDLAKDIPRLEKIVNIWRLLIKGKKVKLRPEDYMKMFLFIKKFESSL